MDERVVGGIDASFGFNSSCMTAVRAVIRLWARQWDRYLRMIAGGSGR